MALSRKAGLEANAALFKAYEEYRKLSAEAARFVVAKSQNNDMLPMHLWREHREWKKRLHAADKELERFYK